MIVVLPFHTVRQLWNPGKCNDNCFLLQLDMCNFDPGLNGYSSSFDVDSNSFPLLSVNIPSYLTCPVIPGLILEWWKISLMQNLCHCSGNHRKFRGIEKKKNCFLVFTVKASSWKAKVRYSWTYSKCCSIHINKQQSGEIYEHHLEPWSEPKTACRSWNSLNQSPSKSIDTLSSFWKGFEWGPDLLLKLSLDSLVHGYSLSVSAMAQNMKETT